MDAKRRLEVGGFVEIVLETLTKRVTIGSDEIRCHFRLADHTVSVATHKSN